MELVERAIITPNRGSFQATNWIPEPHLRPTYSMNSESSHISPIVAACKKSLMHLE
jgi:hypothetical protein